MDQLRAQGFDPDRLDPDEIRKLEKIGTQIMRAANNPERLIQTLRSAGLDPRKLIRKMSGDRSQKHRGTKIGRNDPCPCGSQKKYKKCCLRV